MHVDHSVPALLFCDNKSALQIAANPTLHERTKHVEIDCHIVREKLHQGLIKLMPLSSTVQLADVCTKPLASIPFQEIISKLGMINIYSSTCGGILDDQSELDALARIKNVEEAKAKIGGKVS